MTKNTNKIYLYFPYSGMYQDSTYKTKKKMDDKQKNFRNSQQQAKRKPQHQTYIHMNLSHNMLSCRTYSNLPVTTLTPGKTQPEVPWNETNN